MRKSGKYEKEICHQYLTISVATFISKETGPLIQKDEGMLTNNMKTIILELASAEAFPYCSFSYLLCQKV